jgi:hypothetical protein
MKYGVYISGPGIVGHMLMSTLPGPKPLVYDTAIEAKIQADLIRQDRPYHVVSVSPYREGDEKRGEYASHPDGYTP